MSLAFKLMRKCFDEIKNELNSMGVQALEDFLSLFQGYKIKFESGNILRLIGEFGKEINKDLLYQINSNARQFADYDNLNILLNKIFVTYGTDFHLFAVFYFGQDWINSINVHNFNKQIEIKIHNIQAQAYYTKKKYTQIDEYNIFDPNNMVFDLMGNYL